MFPHEIPGAFLIALQEFQPPGTRPGGSALGAADKIALADDPDKLSLPIDHRHRTDAVFQQELCSVLHTSILTDADDVGHHYVRGFHRALPCRRCDRAAPWAGFDIDVAQADVCRLRFLEVPG
jgi:hypothetical protein